MNGGKLQGPEQLGLTPQIIMNAEVTEPCVIHREIPFYDLNK